MTRAEDLRTAAVELAALAKQTQAVVDKYGLGSTHVCVHRYSDSSVRAEVNLLSGQAVVHMVQAHDGSPGSRFDSGGPCQSWFFAVDGVPFRAIERAEERVA